MSSAAWARSVYTVYPVSDEPLPSSVYTVYTIAEGCPPKTGYTVYTGPGVQETMEAQRLLPGLEQAIVAGGINYRVSGASKPEVLAAVVKLMRLPPEVDRRFLLELLLARETLGSTAIGDGVAIPHVRNPIVLHIPAPSVTVCFLDSPVEFGALDGKPVHTVFAIVSPMVRAHLHLLSLLSYGLRREEFRSPILSQGTRSAILAGARAVDEAARARAEAGAS